MATVKSIEAKFAPTVVSKRVAAYARVSSDKDAMLQSLSAQVSYYNNYITNHPGWELIEIYSDEGISGTKEDRPGFQKMLEDCRNNRIDLIIAKSITRFARNTVILLQTIRELKTLGIDVYFEKENIHTLSSEGEFMITLLASYAQEEARSASENQLWRIHKLFENGMPSTCLYYGYRYDKGKFVIEPGEAEVVREIFDLYLSGYGIMRIAKLLNDRNTPTRLGGKWKGHRIYKMLKDEVYIGNLLLQKTYTKDYISKQRMENRGEKPMYEVIGSHEAIVDENTFYQVQEEMMRRKAVNDSRQKADTPAYKSQFTSLLICGICGKTYRRKKNCGRYVWTCSTYHDFGQKYCNSKRIRDDILTESVTKVLGIERIDDIDIRSVLKEIIICENNILEFHFNNGEVKTLEWKQKSRSESWTKEMREAAGRKTAERYRRNKNGSN